MKSVLLTFEKISNLLTPENQSDELCILSINRPEVANALNAETLDAIHHALDEIKAKKNCRLLILHGNGKHFSAGADLAWMKQAKNLNYQENLADAKKLSTLFEKLASMPIPTLAYVTGSAFGGACGLVACCDYAIASEESLFCLSEAKLGLIPAVIFPYLAKKMLMGDLSRFALSGQFFSAQEAKDAGLIQLSVASQNLQNTLRKEINALLACGPTAQKNLKQLIQFLHINKDPKMVNDRCCEAIASIRVGDEAQKGLDSFFAKQKTPWISELSKDWKIHHD